MNSTDSACHASCVCHLSSLHIKESMTTNGMSNFLIDMYANACTNDTDNSYWYVQIECSVTIIWKSWTTKSILLASTKLTSKS